MAVAVPAKADYVSIYEIQKGTYWDGSKTLGYFLVQYNSTYCVKISTDADYAADLAFYTAMWINSKKVSIGTDGYFWAGYHCASIDAVDG